MPTEAPEAAKTDYLIVHSASEEKQAQKQGEIQEARSLGRTQLWPLLESQPPTAGPMATRMNSDPSPTSGHHSLLSHGTRPYGWLSVDHVPMNMGA